jgi:hypothetical protein
MTISQHAATYIVHEMVWFSGIKGALLKHPAQCAQKGERAVAKKVVVSNKCQ